MTNDRIDTMELDGCVRGAAVESVLDEAPTVVDMARSVGVLREDIGEMVEQARNERDEPHAVGGRTCVPSSRTDQSSPRSAQMAMNNTLDLFMTEHPAWRQHHGGYRRVFALPEGGGRYLCTVSGRQLEIHPLSAGTDELKHDTFTMSSDMPDAASELEASLTGLGSVVRFRNPDLWDAIGTAIIRQVIRAGQSKKLYRAFCETHGEQAELACGETYTLFPQAETVADLAHEQFSSIGMAFKGPPLTVAAEAYMEHGAKWRESSPTALIEELQIVPHIGPWTARAAVADWSNDWALYPYTDLAVRTWAKRAAPSFNWPTDEAAFGRVWRALAGDGLSALTLLTLAWGSQHGDIG